MGVQYESQVNFANTKFKGVPEFNFSSFIQPPHLSYIEVPFLKQGKAVERYRKLKQMSIELKDHANEIKFFGFETHAKAYLDETPWHEKVIIKAYWLLSDFGSSLGRPITALAIYLMLLFAANSLLIQPDNKECIESRSIFISSTLTYILSEALPIFRLKKEQAVSIKQYLFGEKPLDIRHNLWRIAHVVPSTLLIFLFGLGVRNRYKIK